MLESPWPLEQQKLLDVGCGTGSFIEQVHKRFGSANGIDYNEGMLGKAMEKFGGKGDKVTLQQGCAQALPFEDQSFHGCTINQIIHHFSAADNFEEARLALLECYRVLKPGGVLVINTSAPEQQRDGFWWLSLFPENSQRMCARFPPIESLQGHLSDAGFEKCSATGGLVVPLWQTLMHRDLYLDGGLNLAFQKTYRDCDSSWEMPPEELEAGLATLRGMMEKGTADAWLAEREQLRLKSGQASFLIARKPLA